MKEKLENIIDLVKDYPKTATTTILVVLVLLLGSGAWLKYRLSPWFNCVWVQEYKLDRDLVFKHYTGSCMVNQGTETDPKLIPVERLIGTVDGTEE